MEKITVILLAGLLLYVLIRVQKQQNFVMP